MHYNVRGLLISAFVLAGATGGALTAQTASGTNQNNTQYGTSSAEFLLLGAGARGEGLGGTMPAVAINDVSALYYNPGAASMMGRPGLLIGTYDYVGGTHYSWGGLNFPFGGGSNSIGIQIGTFGFNNQPVYTVDQPDGTGTTYSVTETFMGATFARNFSDRFSTGLTLKGVYDQLGAAKGTAFAVDFGTHYHAKLKGHPVNMAFVLSNLGTNLSYNGDGLAVTVPRDTSVGAPVEDPQPGQLSTKGFQLPTNFQIAVSYDVVYTKAMELSALAGFSQPRSNGAGYAFGVEWNLLHLGNSKFGASLRGSYTSAPANNISTTLPTQATGAQSSQGWAGGGALGYNNDKFRLVFDYAYRSMGILGGTNYFSVTLGW